MKINRYQFEVLAYIEKKGVCQYSQRLISDALKISGTEIKKCLEYLIDKALLMTDGHVLQITSKGLEALEPYQVKSAVVFAAGFGSRMVPVTLDTPKPLVKVNGKRIIDTLLDALIASDIKDITIVRGYKKEKFDELLVKYPFIKFVDNDIYHKTNNISSAIAVLDKINQCYICESDLYITNNDIICKYHYSSNYLGSYSLETDDWSFELIDGHTHDYKKGGFYRYNAYGISYWTQEDCIKLRRDLTKAYKEDDNIFWESIPLDMYKDNYKVEIRQCDKADIMEIDNFYELILLDNSYKNYPYQE